MGDVIDIMKLFENPLDLFQIFSKKDHSDLKPSWNEETSK